MNDNDKLSDSHQESESEAFSLSLDAVDTITLQGEFAFCKFERFMNDNAKLSDGDFTKGWKDIAAYFEQKHVVRTVCYDQDYFSMQMEHDDRSPSFVQKLNSKQPC